MFAKTLGGRHAFAEGPFDDLGGGVSWGFWRERRRGGFTFMVGGGGGVCDGVEGFGGLVVLCFLGTYSVGFRLVIGLGEGTEALSCDL